MPYQIIILGVIVGIVIVVVAAIKGVVWLKAKKKKLLKSEEETKERPVKIALGLGQIIKWAWIIIFILIPLTYWVGGLIWKPTFISMKKTFSPKGDRDRLPKYGYYSWKKFDYQYGYNPNQRSGGPFKAKITLNSERLSFEFPALNGGMCYFDGRKEGDKFKGKWRCPKGGGDWELKENPDKPGVYTGLEKDIYLPEGCYAELIIFDFK